MAKEQVEVQKEPEDGMIDVPLGDASHAQMMWFSKHQGYDYDRAETEHQTYNRIKAAWDSPTIRVPAVIKEEVLNVRNAGETYKPSDYTRDQRCGLPEFVEVIVQSNSDDPEETVKLAHQGRTYILQVNEKVKLPWYVFKGCIEDAKTITYASGRDSGLGPIRISQSVSFNRVG